MFFCGRVFLVSPSKSPFFALLRGRMSKRHSASAQEAKRRAIPRRKPPCNKGPPNVGPAGCASRFITGRPHMEARGFIHQCHIACATYHWTRSDTFQTELTDDENPLRSPDPRSISTLLMSSRVQDSQKLLQISFAIQVSPVLPLGLIELHHVSPRGQRQQRRIDTSAVA
jgi:hypothetical protein